jgi:hypothetical protein
MLLRRKYLYLANVLLVIAIFSIPAAAQDKNIWQEYRPSIILAMPVNEKVILFQYNVVIYAPEKKLTTIGTTLPGITYRPLAKNGKGTWLELWAGVLFAWTDNYHSQNSFETRPVVGVRAFVPKLKKVNIINFGRYRHRVSLEVPLAKGDRRWQPKTYYTAVDVEPFWRLDNNFMEKVRLRGTLGYIYRKRLAAEFIYHAEWAGSKGEPKKFVGNIWRFSIKFLFPRGKGIFPRIDIDD